jgi:hypothetical protein
VDAHTRCIIQSIPEAGKYSKSDPHIEAHVDGIIAVLQVTDEKPKEIKEEGQKRTKQ